MKIKLGKKEVYTTVDESDYDYLNQFKWYLSHDGYAYRSVYPNGKQKNIRMHRDLLSAPSDMHVDHINHDRLDNRRSNIRLCTVSQNLFNKPGYGKSGVKGVRLFKPLNKWQARFKHQHLGYFENIEDAARAYNTVALKQYGEFAYLNDIKE